MRAIADNGRFVLAEDGQRLVFLERRGLVPAWAVYVVGLLTAILAMNGVVALVFAFGPGSIPVPVGLGLLVAASLLGWACRGLVRRRAASRERPLAAQTVLLALDRAAGVLRDAAGRELAPLDRVRVVRRFQLTSSSRALHVVWPRGDWVVYRGDPFTGPIDEPADQLERRGVRVE